VLIGSSRRSMVGGDDDHMARRVNRLLEPEKGTQGREGMNSRQKIIGAAAVVAALMGAVPVSATASSLLSGYGGPGQGSQAILGAALLKGPSNGGGRGGGPTGGAAAAAALAASSSPVPQASSPSGASRRAPTPARHAKRGPPPTLSPGVWLDQSPGARAPSGYRARTFCTSSWRWWHWRSPVPRPGS
jgi:hypothetical protein